MSEPSYGLLTVNRFLQANNKQTGGRIENTVRQQFTVGMQNLGSYLGQLVPSQCDGGCRQLQGLC